MVNSSYLYQYLLKTNKQTNNESINLIIGGVSIGGVELGIFLDDFINSVEQIFLTDTLPSGSNGEHPCFSADTSQLSPGTVRGQTGL
jgi:hypothetical protein